MLPAFTSKGQVDIILGKDENGKTAAWVKKYNDAKGSGIYTNMDRPGIL